MTIGITIQKTSVHFSLFDLYVVVFLDDVLNVITEGSCLKVESNKVNSSILKTPYGDIKLEITGEYIKWIKEPFLFEIRYKIKMEQTKEYINELQLQIID